MLLIAFALPGGRTAVIATMQGQIFLGATSAPQALAMLFWLMIQVNLALIFFNFLPIPPLDASRVVRNLLPYNSLNTFDTIGRFGFIVIFILGRFVVGIFMGPAMRLIINPRRLMAFWVVSLSLYAIASNTIASTTSVIPPNSRMGLPLGAST